jgi:hypothetical protein
MFRWTIAQKIASRYLKEASSLIPLEAKKHKYLNLIIWVPRNLQ